MLSAVCLLLIGSAATAQTTRSPSDPGVSVHNYKHPHKAKQAARLAAGTSGTVMATGQSQSQGNMRRTARNYKASNGSNQNSDALLVLPGREVERTNNPLMAKDNYKRQHRPATPAKIPVPARPVEAVAEGEKSTTPQLN